MFSLNMRAILFIICPSRSIKGQIIFTAANEVNFKRYSTEQGLIGKNIFSVYQDKDLNNNILKYSGANNPCWIIRDNELIELKPIKQAITASVEYEKKTFTDDMVW